MQTCPGCRHPANPCYLNCSPPPSSSSSSSPPPAGPAKTCGTCGDVATPVWSCAQQVIFHATEVQHTRLSASCLSARSRHAMPTAETAGIQANNSCYWLCAGAVGTVRDLLDAGGGQQRPQRLVCCQLRKVLLLMRSSVDSFRNPKGCLCSLLGCIDRI